MTSVVVPPLLVALLCLLTPWASAADISIKDADGRVLVLQQPAGRIVTLAPHLTDMLLELGARARIVGVSDDHDSRGAHATSLSGFPVVSDAAAVNHEKLMALKPDLVLAWGSGTPRAWVEQLRRQGLPVFVLEARQLQDLPRQLEQLGQLTGLDEAAKSKARGLRQQIDFLQARYGGGERLRYFLQIWRQPLYTLDASHLLSQALAHCGLDNIVQAGPVTAPLINPEFVLRQNPDVIFLPAEDEAASMSYWQRFPGLLAVRKKQWLVMEDKRLTRPGIDMISAVFPVCAQIHEWKRNAATKSR